MQIFYSSHIVSLFALIWVGGGGVLSVLRVL